jgi:hypothetical protein
MANTTHRIVKTPNPSVWSLAVTVKAEILAGRPDFTPVEGTAYKDFPKWFKDSAFMKYWGDYTYVQSEDGQDPESVRLIFVKNFTPQEAAQPFRTIESFGDHSWPAIMKAIAFPPVQGIHGSHNGVVGGRGGIVVSKLHIERRVVVPPVSEGSKFITEEFFSNVPFAIPLYEVPIPTEVSWDIPDGPKGSFVGLHPKILIPDTQTATAGIVQGEASNASGICRGQFFPATNFEGWQRYVLKHTQTFQNGYYAIRVWVEPPNEPEKQII